MKEEPLYIAVDAMGGDYAPSAVIEGAALAQREANGDFRVVLVGDEQKIAYELKRLKVSDLHLLVEHAAETIEMDDSAAEAWRKKKDASISVAMRLQKENRVSAVVSAGHTGAVVVSALLTLGKLSGVDRPAIASLFPTEKDGVVVLDVGANPVCKATNLYQFGIMGSIYTNYIFSRKNPKIGLLSIGEEESKGNQLTWESHKLLSESELNFVGNVEGRDVLKGTSDVVVCDGFTGNVMLKFAEGVEGFLTTWVKKHFRRDLFTKLGAWLLKPSLKRLKRVLDYSEYGGAPLLGVDGVCIICHGGSSPKAVKNAILMAFHMVKSNVNLHIKEKLFQWAKIE